VLGVLLLLVAARNWRKRPAPGAEAPMPGWMATIDGFTPPKALGVAVVLSAVNPKVLVLTIGAATNVAQAGVSTGDAAVGLAVFVVLASSSIVIPVVLHVAGGERVASTLDGWKAWLSTNNATVMAVLFLVFGVVLFSQGLRELTA
jgi:threonine/homoserine/homoserine lactone efflux protein